MSFGALSRRRRRGLTRMSEGLRHTIWVPAQRSGDRLTKQVWKPGRADLSQTVNTYLSYAPS